MAKTKGKGGKGDRNFLEREVLLAMRLAGWLAPETEAEVLDAEKELTTKRITIPTSFNNPRELLHGAGSARRIVHPQPYIPRAEEAENLARAAREGGTISPEVEERMKRDRDAAEAKSRTK